VLVTIRNALDRRAARREPSLKRAVESRHQMVGESRPLRQVWDADQARRADQRHRAAAWESGVGKELVARSIHRNSLRSRERFVQVNCARSPKS
jgi:DNA-binding NtrC family response regulator